MEFVPEQERYIVKLDIFEGPLDLLLYLIRKHELDIYDVPIAFITARYLEYLDLMKELNLDLAAEYLEMAATLALIKSKMLVPSDPSGDEDDPDPGPDPREELVRRLLEYQKYKTAAEELQGRPMLGRDTFPRGAEVNIAVDRGLSSPGLFGLMEAFQQILKRADTETFHEISITRISVTERINQLVDLLRGRPSLSFTDMFEGQKTRGDMVVTFMSILEMAKLRLLKIHQAAPHGEIYIDATRSLVDAEETLEQHAPEPEEL